MRSSYGLEKGRISCLASARSRCFDAASKSKLSCIRRQHHLIRGPLPVHDEVSVRTETEKIPWADSSRRCHVFCQLCSLVGLERRSGRVHCRRADAQWGMRQSGYKEVDNLGLLINIILSDASSQTHTLQRHTTIALQQLGVCKDAHFPDVTSRTSVKDS